MKKAFTMIELVFVIVVIGILAATILPRTKTNPLQEAGIQLLSNIRYIQHLAMVDDKFNGNDRNWYKGRWQIVFSHSKYTDHKLAYTIFSDQPTYGGDATEKEIAKNPANPNQIMTGGYGNAASINYMKDGFKGMKKLNLGSSYGIRSVLFSSSCTPGTRISFDYIGRPLHGDSSSMKTSYTASTDRLLKKDCNITLSDGTYNLVITIRPETGYTSITQWK